MKFTVLISVYWKENPAFLKEALKSIENQILTPDEIVLVKDGSLTPDLDTVIDNQISQSKIFYKIVKLEKNSGLGNALSRGLAACSSEWIARMDSDDISDPKRFIEQINYLKENPDIDILGSWISEFDTDLEKQIYYRKPPRKHDEIIKYAKYRNPLNHVTVIFRKSSVEAAGGYIPMVGFEDYYLWIRMLQKGYNFANIGETLVNVRIGNEMIKRRRGLKYIKSEWAFEKAGWELGFFSTYELLRNMFIRIIPRLMPDFLLEKVYNLLRKT